MLRFVKNWIRVVCLAILWMLAMSCALCTGLQLVLNLDLLNTAVFQSKTSKLCIYCIRLCNQRWWWCPLCVQIIFQMDTVGVKWFSSVLFVNFRQQVSKSPLSFFVSLQSMHWGLLWLSRSTHGFICICYCVFHVFVFAFFAFIFAIVYLIHMYLSLIHIWRCRRLLTCRSRWSPYH